MLQVFLEYPAKSQGGRALYAVKNSVLPKSVTEQREFPGLCRISPHPNKKPASEEKEGGGGKCFRGAVLAHSIAQSRFCSSRPAGRPLCAPLKCPVTSHAPKLLLMKEEGSDSRQRGVDFYSVGECLAP